MKKKLKTTNLETGKDRYESHRICSRVASAYFCPECRAYGMHPHYPGCKGKFVEISAAAQIPKKSANKREWAFFIRKFVNREFLKKAYEKALKTINQQSKLNAIKYEKIRRCRL